MSQPVAKKATDNKASILADTDDEVEDVDVTELYAFADESDKATKKMATRRKIDLYLEKKRLKKELDYFDELDFDFDDET